MECEINMCQAKTHLSHIMHIAITSRKSNLYEAIIRHINSNNHCVTHKDIHKIYITKHSFTYLFANLMKFPLMIYIKYQSTKYVTKAAVFHHIASFINMHIILSNFFK